MQAELKTFKDHCHQEVASRIKLEDQCRKLWVYRQADKETAELDQNWVILSTHLETLHPVQGGGLDLS